jgi:hypothetical protein
MYVVAMLLLTANTATTRAADISCDLSYGQSNPFRPKYSQQGPVDFSTLPPLGDIDGVAALDPDLASRHWPSGSRPKQSTCQVAFLQGKI